VRYVDVPGANPDVDTREDLAALESKLVVATGYDALGPAYPAWSARVIDPGRTHFVDQLDQRLPQGAAVLDLGCGPGIPSTRQLAHRFQVTGVDISAGQLALASANVPGAKFVQADISTVTFPDSAFDAVTAFYSLIHLPRTELAHALARIARWLRPGGLFLATFSTADNPAWTGDWLGQPMFFSSYDAATNLQLLSDAGFEIVSSQEVDITEPEGPASFLWVLARRPSNQIATTASRTRPMQ